MRTQVSIYKCNSIKKYIGFQLLCFVISIIGNTLNAQNTLSQTNISLQVRDITIKELFSTIEKHTNYVILYEEDVPVKERVSVFAENKSVESILNEVLTPRGIKYYLNGKQIIVTVDKTKQQSKKSNAKKSWVSGTVVDIAGEAMIGVTIAVQGAQTGTVTDADGKYRIEAQPGDILVFSFVGMKKQEVTFNGKKQVIDIVMDEETNLMDEVVVVGFGTQKKVNLTGAVGVIESKSLEARPVGNAVQALQGLLPGLNITTSNNGAELNATPSINIRGTATIGSTSSGSPLVLIDGMEGSLSNINPQDIDNISVLKDAAASSIYGSRAPFGVILVTTKSGKKGKSTVNYSNNFRFKTPVMLPKMANSWDYINYFNDANFNNAGAYLYDDTQVQNVWDYMHGTLNDGGIQPNSNGKWDTGTAYANVDWLREYYKDWSPSQEHNLSVSGGTDKLTYYVSVNYQTQDGFLRYGTDNQKRFATTGKISSQVTDFIKMDYTTRFSRTDYGRPSQMSSNFYNEVLRRSVPLIPVTDPNGYRLADVTYTEHLENGGRRQEQNDDLYQQLKLTITPVKNWNIMAEMNARITNDWQHEVWNLVYGHYATEPLKTYVSNLSQKKSRVYEYAYRATHLTPNFYSNYNIALGEHNLAAMVGFQLESYKNRMLSGQRNDLISEDIPVLDQTTDVENATLKGNYNEWCTVGFFGRVNYDYKERYLLEVNVRRDGSSRYRRDKRWITSPSASLGWNIAREEFMKGTADYIQLLKLRASYGVLANQNAKSYYPTYLTMTTAAGKGDWLIDGLRPNTAAAPGLISTSLTWEKIKTLNFGLDWGVLNNRLTGSFDIYSRTTKDMMGPGVDLPGTLGTSAPATNNTDLVTKGWELQIGWKDRINEFQYGVSFNLSDSRTKILKYPNLTGSLSTYYEGQILGDIFGYETIGIAKTDEEMEAHLASLPNGGQNALGSKWAAGDIMYADTNGDGKVSNGSNTIYDMGDLRKIGNSTPRFRTGISLDASWRGFAISMFWQGVLKRDYYPDAKVGSASTDLNFVFWGATSGGKSWSVVFDEHMNYFRDEDSRLGANYDAYYPRPLWANKNKSTQTRYLQNASYMRLKNLQLSYTFPAKWMRRAYIQNLRLFVSGENLLTFTKLSKTMDPETAGIGLKGGMVYPLSKTYSFGLSVTF